MSTAVASSAIHLSEGRARAACSSAQQKSVLDIVTELLQSDLACLEKDFGCPHQPSRIVDHPNGSQRRSMRLAAVPHIECGKGADRPVEQSGSAGIGKIDRSGDKNSFDSGRRECNRRCQPCRASAYDDAFGIHSRHAA